MAEAKLYGQNKGGMSINGIIKDYYAYAGENIKAGDLVEYINGVAGKKDYGESVDTQLSTETNSGYAISAVQLDENRVFIAHSLGPHKLYGRVVTIEGPEIYYGYNAVELSSEDYSGAVISTCLLQNGNVLVAHSSSSKYQLYAIVAQIDGTTVIPGTDTKLRSYYYSGYAISLCTLSNGNVFIAHCKQDASSDYTLIGEVLNINGTTIESIKSTSLSGAAKSGERISTCLLPNNNVFIAHSYGSNYYLYGKVVNISDSGEMTDGEDTVISNSTKNTGYRISAVALDDTRVFIAYAHTDGSSYLYGIVCTISGTTITKGAETQIAHEVRAAHTIGTIKLDDNKVFIAHSYTSSMYLYGIVVNIDGTAITPGVDTCMNDSSIYATNTMHPLVMLNNGTILIAHSYTTSYYLYAQIFGIDYENNIPTNHIIATEYETQVRQVTTGQFYGIAKTSGLGGDDTGHKDIVSIWTKE